MLADALEHLVRGIVDNPDDVTVRDKQLRRGSILEVRVHPDDLGKVIGRNGRTATAFRPSSRRSRARRRPDRLRRRRPPTLTQLSSLEWVSPPRGGTRSAFEEKVLVSTSSTAGELDRRALDRRRHIEVVVGRIGKPHGLRGEVTVDVRTDEPERRFAPGAVLRAQAAAGLRQHPDCADRRRRPLALVDAARDVRGDPRPQRRRGGARDRAARRGGPADETPEDPDEFYDHQLIGLAAYDHDGTPARRGHRGRPRRRPGPAGDPYPRRPGHAGAVRRGAGARGRPGRRSGRRRRPARPGHAAARGLTTSRTRHADRRRLDLPGLPRRRSSSRCPARPATSGLLDVRVHDLREWAHDRHRTVDDTPYGGGAGMVMKPEPWGEALDDVLARRARRPRSSSRRLRAAVHPGGGPRAGERRAAGLRLRALRGHRPAGASTTPRPAARSARSRSATTCSTGARWPRWRSSRPSSGCCPGSWATPSRWSRSPTRTGCWSTPSTPSRPPGAATTSRRCCCRGDHAAIAAWRHDQAVRRTAERRPDLLPPGSVLPRRRRGRGPAATPGDAGELLTLQRACWVQEQQANPGVGSRRCTRASTTSARGSPRGRPCWSRARPAGWSARSGPAATGEAWDIGRLMVAPDLQGRGLGPLLLERDRGARPRRTSTSYALFTGAGSARNQRMYKKAGYRLAAARPAPEQSARCDSPRSKRHWLRGAVDSGSRISRPRALWQTCSSAQSAKQDRPEDISTGGPRRSPATGGARRRRPPDRATTERIHRYRG